MIARHLCADHLGLYISVDGDKPAELSTIIHGTEFTSMYREVAGWSNHDPGTHVEVWREDTERSCLVLAEPAQDDLFGGAA